MEIQPFETIISFTLERLEGRGTASISSSYYWLEYPNSVLTPFNRACLLISLFKDSEASKLASIKAGLITGSGLANVEAVLAAEQMEIQPFETIISFTLERLEGRGTASISSSYYWLEYPNSVLTPFNRACLLISLFKDSEASKLASIKAGLITGSGLANVEAGSWVEFHDEF
nr:hypothetical protein [Tanacetum cinerariifolium]